MTMELADFFRYTYAVLAGLVAFGFTLTLILRWSVLKRGERILRVGLVLEHIAAIYGAWMALKLDFPPTFTGLAVAVSLAVVLLGFVIWLVDDVLPGDIDMRRLIVRRR